MDGNNWKSRLGESRNIIQDYFAKPSRMGWCLGRKHGKFWWVKTDTSENPEFENSEQTVSSTNVHGYSTVIQGSLLLGCEPF